jgi:hypothetical protein
MRSQILTQTQAPWFAPFQTYFLYKVVLQYFSVVTDVSMWIDNGKLVFWLLL